MVYSEAYVDYKYSGIVKTFPTEGEKEEVGGGGCRLILISETPQRSNSVLTDYKLNTLIRKSDYAVICANCTYMTSGIKLVDLYIFGIIY